MCVDSNVIQRVVPAVSLRRPRLVLTDAAVISPTVR